MKNNASIILTDSSGQSRDFRIVLLQAAFSDLQCALQSFSSISNYHGYMMKADALVSILEVVDCGSVGGFDRENKCVHTTGISIYDRFLTVLRKYDDEQNIKPVAGFTPGRLTIGYKRLYTLRDDIPHPTE